jgi:hypothetical protein
MEAKLDPGHIISFLTVSKYVLGFFISDRTSIFIRVSWGLLPASISPPLERDIMIQGINSKGV